MKKRNDMGNFFHFIQPLLGIEFQALFINWKPFTHFVQLRIPFDSQFSLVHKKLMGKDFFWEPRSHRK